MCEANSPSVTRRVACTTRRCASTAGRPADRVAIEPPERAPVSPQRVTQHDAGVQHDEPWQAREEDPSGDGLRRHPERVADAVVEDEVVVHARVALLPRMVGRDLVRIADRAAQQARTHAEVRVLGIAEVTRVEDRAVDANHLREEAARIHRQSAGRPEVRFVGGHAVGREQGLVECHPERIHGAACRRGFHHARAHEVVAAFAHGAQARLQCLRNGDGVAVEQQHPLAIRIAQRLVDQPVAAAGETEVDVGADDAYARCVARVVIHEPAVVRFARGVVEHQDLRHAGCQQGFRAGAREGRRVVVDHGGDHVFRDARFPGPCAAFGHRAW